MKRLIRYNPSIGAYRKDTGELMAWCLCQVVGSLGSLQVKEQYLRQGLGALLVKSMSKIFMNCGMESFAAVVVNNIASDNMFKKLGFEKTDIIYWNRTIPSDPEHVWKDSGDE
ncbi:uncharacterized protein LOC129608331 [Condylostylus longicornis]|uniref:uncharacterized protein LOC129608331 n=1 Tax=Condylostylus longicornis TaxID=2530218 RepID=UPI00244E221F|nr:uncharacterized protein LOC129608331 [Condylostylus longicornis]